MRLSDLKKSDNGKPEHHKKKATRGRLKQGERIAVILELLVYIFFVTTFLLKPFVIPTGSMEDSLLVGDHILLDRVVFSRSLGFLDGIWFPQKEIERGLIVTFKAPPEMDKLYVKRVIGLPGDTVRILYKKVYINGIPLSEPYVYYKDHKTNVPGRDNFPQYRVPADHYFLMGDNRDKSADSRRWGAVPLANIVGAPWRIYWSFRSTSENYLASGFFPKMKNLFITLIHFFPRTRWHRTGKRIE
jgi:signal peptidase I